MSECLPILKCAVFLLPTLAAIASAYFAYIANKLVKKQINDQKYKDLQDTLREILKIGVQYPYFERKDFTSAWSVQKYYDEEKYTRYDFYCNLIYNYLHDVFEYFEGDREKIEGYIDVKHWIRLHKANWIHSVDDENLDAYDEEFRNFINSYIS